MNRMSSLARATYCFAVIGLSGAVGLVQAQSSEDGRAPPGYAVATAHPLATKVGLAVLASGGNAFDAAVAVSAALGVVEPYGSGLGGGGFYLLHRAGMDSDIFLDAREKAPGAATGDMYLDRDGQPVKRMSRDGPLAAAIPGTPAALEYITELFGLRTLEDNLAPAISLARGGFEVDTELATRITASAHRFSPAARAVFMPKGEVPVAGDRLKQADLAATLQAIAQDGAKVFYRGKIANALQKGVFSDGGIWSAEDLKNYRVKEREPQVIHYRHRPARKLPDQGTPGRTARVVPYDNYRIVTAPLPSAGGITLAQILNILENRDWPPEDATQARHELIEAMRLAYRDRARFLGDADFVDVDVDKLAGKGYAAELASAITVRATPSKNLPLSESKGSSEEGRNTTHFSILDAEGNRVSATLTINTWFGSAYMPPGTGVLLNNEMDDFATAPLVPNAFGLVHTEANAIQPHKRPLSSMSPTFVEGPKGVYITGSPGGSRIITTVLLSVLGHMNGLSVEQTAAAPRFHHQFLPDAISFEPLALTEDQREALRARGHDLQESTRQYGNLQAIHWDVQRNTLEAASDPRGVGAAAVRLQGEGARAATGK